MRRAAGPVRIGSFEISPEELVALRTYRDYKRLRDMAGWRYATFCGSAQAPEDFDGDRAWRRANQKTRVRSKG